MRQQRGFTLIELLIAIAIIGILTTIATVSLVQARRRARDTKRVSDIQQLRNALVIYSNTRATYPPSGGSITLGQGSAGCMDDSDQGFHSAGTCTGLTIMNRVPGEAVTGHAPYTYAKAGNDYTITFTLEGAIGDLPGGACTAKQNGITCP